MVSENTSEVSHEDIPDAGDACVLCDELNDNKGLSSKIILPQYRKPHIISSTSGLALLHDICPIVPGHCLFVTKSHYFSFSEARRNLLAELEYLKKAAISMVLSKGCDYFYFEHGANSTRNGGGCVSHAHIHFIPAQVNVLRHVKNIAPKDMHIGFVSMKNDLPKDGSEYLYYEDMTGKGFVALNPRILQRQFIRLVVANELGISEWSWTSKVLKYTWVKE